MTSDIDSKHNAVYQCQTHSHQGNPKDFIKICVLLCAKHFEARWDAEVAASFLQVWKTEAQNSTVSQCFSTSNPHSRNDIIMTLSCNDHGNWFSKDKLLLKFLKKKNFARKTGWMNGAYALTTARTHKEKILKNISLHFSGILLINDCSWRK